LRGIQRVCIVGFWGVALRLRLDCRFVGFQLGRVKRLELRVQRFELWVVGIWLFELWSFRFWDEDPSHIRKRRLNRIALWLTPYGRRARPSVSSHGSPMGTADGAAHWPCLAATPDRRSSGCHRNGDRAHSPLACDAADRR